MEFWLRENAIHSKTFAAPFRFTIGGRIGRSECLGLVGNLKIGLVTRNPMAGVCEARRVPIL